MKMEGQTRELHRDRQSEDLFTSASGRGGRSGKPTLSDTRTGETTTVAGPSGGKGSL